MTTSTPRSPQGSAAGSRSARTLILRVADQDRVAVHAHVLRQGAQHRVVFEQVRQRGVVGQVVRGDDLDLLGATVPRGRWRRARPASSSARCGRMPLMPTRIVTAASLLVLSLSTGCCTAWSSSRGARAFPGSDPIGRSEPAPRPVRAGRPGAIFGPASGRAWERDEPAAASAITDRYGVEHLRREAGFGVGDTQVRARLSAMASSRRIRPAIASLVSGGSASWPSSSRLACRCSIRSRPATVRCSGASVAQDLQGPLDPGAGRDRGPGAAPQVGVVEVGQPVGGGPDLAPHPAFLPGQHAVVGAQPGQQRADRVAVPDHDPVAPRAPRGPWRGSSAAGPRRPGPGPPPGPGR